MPENRCYICAKDDPEFGRFERCDDDIEGGISLWEPKPEVKVLTDKLDAVTALLTEYGVLPLAQRSNLAPPVALNYEQACRIAEVLNA